MTIFLHFTFKKNDKIAFSLFFSDRRTKRKRKKKTKRIYEKKREEKSKVIKPKT